MADRKWWEYLFVPFRYGNFGSPGYSGGKWVDSPTLDDLESPPAYDTLDTYFKAHDRSFNDPQQDNMTGITTANILLIGQMCYGALKYQVIVLYALLVAVGFTISLPFTILFFLWRDVIKPKL